MRAGGGPLEEETFAMVKDLEDGGRAVGLCNMSSLPGECR